MGAMAYRLRNVLAELEGNKGRTEDCGFISRGASGESGVASVWEGTQGREAGCRSVGVRLERMTLYNTRFKIRKPVMESTKRRQKGK